MKRFAIVIAIVCTGSAVWWHGCDATSRWEGVITGEQKVVLDCSSTRLLDDFDNERAREALLRHLCASADWRVTPHLEIVEPEMHVKSIPEAEKRARPTLGPDGWPGKGKTGRPFVSVRFDSSPDGYWKKRRYVLAKAGAKAVEVPLSTASDDSHAVDSTVMIQGGSLILTIGEYRGGHERILTKRAMQKVAEELAAVRENVEEVERLGYLRKRLPNGSLRESVADVPLEIREGSSRGMYWVSGHVNPQEKGYITMRTFHVGTGKELDADVHSRRTAQYVGWSANRDEKFFFEYELAGPSYLTEEEERMDFYDPRRYRAMQAQQNIRVEVWFHGKKKRKLLEATKILTPWMR